MTTSILGAVCITWSVQSSVGPPQTLYLAGALVVVGLVSQTWFITSSPESEQS